MYVCDICSKCPSSHSFDILKEDQNQVIYYSCPSKSIKPHDHDGIIEHYKGMLADKQTKQWTWIIDGTDFDIKQVDVKINLALAKLLETHIHTLDTIVFINSTRQIKMALSMTCPFLSKEFRKRIKIE
jgi:hypothetical protein